MQTSFMKTVAVGALFSASAAFGAITEKSATPKLDQLKGQCKGKACTPVKRVIFDSLKGASETTKLPDTARSEDARGGILI